MWQVEAIVYQRIFLIKMLMMLQSSVQEPLAAIPLPMRHSYLGENFRQPWPSPPPAVAENGCLVTHLHAWLKNSVGCGRASRFDSSSCGIRLPLAAYLIDCQQKWNQPTERCSLHLIWIPRACFSPLMTVRNSRVALKYRTIANNSHKISFSQKDRYKQNNRELQSSLYYQIL